MELVENIDAYCASRTITRKAFERQCGIPNSSVHKWQAGIQNPSLRSIQRIADATGIPVCEWTKKGGIA